MTLDRAWSRRPVVSGGAIGDLLPPLWTESTVVFNGPGDKVDNGHGGFTQTARVDYLTTRAHVEIVTTTEPIDGAPAQVRRLRIYMPWVEAGHRRPQRGDTIRWTADTGKVYTLGVHTVTSPENLASHLEIESEAVD